MREGGSDVRGCVRRGLAKGPSLLLVTGGCDSVIRVC